MGHLRRHRGSAGGRGRERRELAVRPPDGGARWLTVFTAGNGGAGISDLGFTTAADGVAVYGPVYQNDNSYGLPGKLLPTSDGGASWTAVKF